MEDCSEAITVNPDTGLPASCSDINKTSGDQSQKKQNDERSISPQSTSAQPQPELDSSSHTTADFNQILSESEPQQTESFASCLNQNQPETDRNVLTISSQFNVTSTSNTVEPNEPINVTKSYTAMSELEESNSLQDADLLNQNASEVEQNRGNNCYQVDVITLPYASSIVQEVNSTAHPSCNENPKSSMEEDSNSQNPTMATSENAVQAVDISELEKSLNEGLLVEQTSRITDAIHPVRLEMDSFQIPVVNIYAEDKGPKFYDVSENLISKPIIPKKLSEAFSDLPIFGRPKNKSALPEFQENKIKEFVGCDLDDSEFEKLAAYCSPDNLRTGEELVMQNNPGQGFFPSEMERLTKNCKDFTSNHDLCIVRKHKLRTEKDIKNLYAKRNKYRGIRMMSLGYDDEDNTPVVTLGTPVTPGKDLLFFIRWYRPFSYNPKDKNQLRSRHSVFSCNIVVLGRHRLAALRERLVCPNDLDMRLDVAARPDGPPRSSAKEMFPSGFLFINNVFYVDTRPGCADYTAPLRHWAAAKGIGDFDCKDMCEVKMEDLVVKLGHPEVYVHQGNCEHLFTISEIRLVNSSDPLKLAAYPCHTALSQNQTIYCTTCAEFGAKWIVVGCSRVPFDPAFFCEKCFKLYLYKDGEKIGDFKAYLYRGNEISVLKPQG